MSHERCTMGPATAVSISRPIRLNKKSFPAHQQTACRVSLLYLPNSLILLFTLCWAERKELVNYVDQCGGKKGTTDNSSSSFFFLLGDGQWFDLRERLSRGGDFNSRDIRPKCLPTLKENWKWTSATAIPLLPLRFRLHGAWQRAKRV